jgi:hypothetical protein
MNQEDEDKQASLKMLLIKRANLLNTAVNKLDTLSDLLDQEPHVEHTLFYCAPKQIDQVIRLVGWEKVSLSISSQPRKIQSKGNHF